MNRIVLAAVALAAVGGGVYFLVQPPVSQPTSGLETSKVAPPAPETARKTDLVDPQSEPKARADLERPVDARKPSQPVAPLAGGGAPVINLENLDPAVPTSLPVQGEVDEKPFFEKYASATTEERKLAIESLTLFYKDAASGRIKDGEKMLNEIQSELEWLERNLQP